MIVSDEKLTAYEAQVLIGTSISGCNMAPDQTFDLKAAWASLHTMGLIDRTDGLAIATPTGAARIDAMIAAALHPAAVNANCSKEVAVKDLEWHKSHMASWQEDWYTTTPFIYTIRCADENGWKWSAHGAYGYASTPEAAKAAAQADFEQRIRSALVPKPVAVTDEMIERAAREIAKHTYARVLPHTTDCAEWELMEPFDHKVYLSAACAALTAILTPKVTP